MFQDRIAKVKDLVAELSSRVNFQSIYRRMEEKARQTTQGQENQETTRKMHMHD